VTDSLILAIPIPMLWKLQVRFSKKLVIGALLCSGLFVIAAAIIRAVLTLGSAPSGLNINRWGVRETIVGLITVNVPILRPMFNRGFWSREQYRGPRTVEEGAGWTSRTSKSRYGKGTFALRSGINSVRDGKLDVELDSASNGSQENIIRKSQEQAPWTGEVLVKTTYHVQSRQRDDGSSSMGARSKDGCQTDVVALNRNL
jgi:hypothetical protein